MSRTPGGPDNAQRRRLMNTSESERLRAAPRRGATTTAKGADLSHSLLQWFAIIAPLTTVATALSFWFGWTMTATRTAYFGIDQSILEYSTVDYLLRSADAIIVPAILILLVGVLCIGVYAVTASMIRRLTGLVPLRIGAWLLLLVGTVVTLLAVWSIFEEPPFATFFLFEPAVLGGGIGLCAYGFWVLRCLSALNNRETRHLPVWEKLGYVSVVLLVVVALFWACSLYAGALGTGRSREYARDLYKRPSVTVYSSQSLAIGSPVKEEVISSPDGKYRFKYTGLKFVTLSAGKYFLLPAGWSRTSGVAIILDDDAENRIEFNPGGG